MEMYKVRATKDKRSILIFINDKTCISISRKYLALERGSFLKGLCMNQLLIQIIKTMLEHFWIITLSLIASSFLKKCLFIFVELKKIQYQNKDVLKLAISNEQTVLEIESSNIKTTDLKNLKEQNILDFKKTGSE